VEVQEMLYQQLGTVPNFQVINLKDPENSDIKENAPLYFSAVHKQFNSFYFEEKLFEKHTITDINFISCFC
jgi:hypothetical protein